MKVLLCFCLLFHFYTCNIYDEEKLFKNFIVKFKKQYQPGSAEFYKRFAIFSANLKKSDRLNSYRTHNSSAIYGITKFSDLTAKEFEDIYLHHKYVGDKIPQVVPILQSSQNAGKVIQVPDKLDWRQNNSVTNVRNQGSCGGCWAFSVVETMESMYKIQHDQLPYLSIQQMLDCSQGYRGLYSCSGGDIESALAWLKYTNSKLTEEAKYPLTYKKEACLFSTNSTVGVGVKSFSTKSYVGNEQRMARQLQHGPLAVAVDASTWNNYLGGIIQYHCGGSHYNNHAVQVVGYDMSGEIPYFIVKNSWGEDFGDNGYVYIKIGSNVCGIAREVAQVNVTK